MCKNIAASLVPLLAGGNYWVKLGYLDPYRLEQSLIYPTNARDLANREIVHESHYCFAFKCELKLTIGFILAQCNPGQAVNLLRLRS